MSNDTSHDEEQEGQGKEWVAFQQSMKRGGNLVGLSDNTSSDEEGEGQGKEWVPFQQRVQRVKRGKGGKRAAAVKCSSQVLVFL